MTSADPSFDARLRREADRWLTVRTNDGTRPIRWDELEEFEFDGQPFKLRDRQRGIRKPAGLDAALSITTRYTPPGGQPVYADEVGADGLIRYKYRRDRLGESDNAALRSAMAAVAEETRLEQFVIAPDTVRGVVSPGELDQNLRRYALRQTRQRLHQPVFRATVLRAYEVRCAVCALGYAELLDAAHIVPDSDDRGIASVRNGLALCTIHHRAYDVSVLGIRPDLVVEIRHDLLAEIDGPMLEHGLQRRHRQPLMTVPRRRANRPDPILLEERYATFRDAG